ncbi:MAG TPA: phosphoribosylaminoimidazolesuccinocarboxamide synthase [Mycobacteriales bacterium]|nr:phosphoribosylaminoimidazolesuccinocarboxamide synthase [Mycobacteriales bacterium]
MIPGLTAVHSGKVRDLYSVGSTSGGEDQLLLVASDRISAFDVILPTPIPDKGAVLTGLSMWWFDQLADVLPHHVVAAKVDDYPPELKEHADALRGRSMLCKKLTMVPVECVARGYLTGSGLKDYAASGAVCGVALPPGLVDGSELPEPIFTPTTKAPVGEHDLPMTYDEVEGEVGAELAAELRRTTIEVYRRGVELAAKAGIILADTKVELGHDEAGVLTLGDEVLTPDSSRFWPTESYEPGRAQPSYDKQYVRDWLSASGWDKRPPAPDLPAEVVEKTRAKYIEAYERLTGSSFDSYLRGA